MKRLNIGTVIVIAVAAALIGAVFGQPGNGQAAGSGPAGTAGPTISGTARRGSSCRRPTEPGAAALPCTPTHGADATQAEVPAPP